MDVISSWSRCGAPPALDRDGPVEVPFDRFEDCWVERPIVARFEWIAARHTNDLALEDGERRFTYGALRRAVRCLARHIDATVPLGRPVGVLLASGALYPLAALAALAAGRPYVPIDSRYPAARNAQVMSDAELAAVIVDDAAPALTEGLARIEIAAALMEEDEPAPLVVAADGPAFILYTSGSTGQPKGICNEQRAILQRVAQFTNAAHLQAQDRIILLSSPGTIAGIRDTLAALLNGASLFVADPHEVGVRGVLETLRRHRITICYAVPALLRQLLAVPAAAQAFAHLRVLRLGGDIALASDLALCRAVLPSQCHVMIGFGSTEAPTVFQWFAPPSWQPDGLRLPVGRAAPGVDFAVLAGDGTPVAAGEAGELVLRSRYLALGHWRHGCVDPGPLRADLADSSYRIMPIGDLVRQREDGLWELVGRTDRQVKIRGLRVDLGEVDAALRSSPAVADAAVIARTSGDEVVALIAYVVPHPRAGEALDEMLHGLVAARVPQHMRPAAIRYLAEIPQLPGFKPDVAALLRLDRQELERQATAASPPIEATMGEAPWVIRDAVERAWASVLDRRSLQADQRWDEAGGDSLKAMQLWFHIEERLGRRLTLDALDERTTPRGLMAALATALAPDGPAPALAAGGAAAPLVFLMPGVAGDEPLLVRFRTAFGGTLRFKLTDYPEWRETMEARLDFSAIVTAVVATIVAETSEQPYLLAGYSYGGFVAYAAAQRLIQHGHRVAFLGLLDSRRASPGEPRRLERYLRLLRAPRRWPGAALRATRRWPVVALRGALATLVRMGCHRLLRSIADRVLARPSRMAFTFHRHFIDMLRVEALRHWQPAPIAVPTTLFLSDERISGLAADYGWGGLCRALALAPIGGTHASMMEPPLRDRLCAEFLRAVERGVDVSVATAAAATVAASS
jgi:amino acid adenylation domain-containing protein